MGKTVPVLQEEIDGNLFAEYYAHSRIEPSGSARTNIYLGMILCHLVNAFRGKGQAVKKVSDFVPEYGRSELWEKHFKNIDSLSEDGQSIELQQIMGIAKKLSKAGFGTFTPAKKKDE